MVIITITPIVIVPVGVNSIIEEDATFTPFF